ncbi:DUF1778 domain-containing protein [Fulvivirgaceae bacterium BMA12]|uniref:DUF1778 domain-containing protein n=1 Tax=Agaribacillus aureus TaxID=3051825 RepID=A0ABT8L0J9_9BACT|nr:DUF1778 domain-containing protein [Fulvivirgaceae bacterium BMA12]
MESQINKDERIEIRVSSQDKRIFKRAQELSGDKTFSSFIIRVVRMQAESIISEKERILASNRDRKVFFDAVFGNQEPNKNLATAARRYKSKITSK